MALSRMALLLAAIQSPAAAAQAPVTAEQAIEMHRETLETSVNVFCPPGGTGDEIVVCGSREPSPYRYTGPVSREAGARTELPGEVGRAPMSVGGCLRLCHQPVMINVIGAAKSVVGGIKKIFDPDR